MSRMKNWWFHDLAKEQRLNLRKVSHCRHDWKYTRCIDFAEGNAHVEHACGGITYYFACTKCGFKQSCGHEQWWGILPRHGLSDSPGCIDAREVIAKKE